VALPLFATAFVLNFVDFTVIWRYFGWANQTLAAVALWTGAVFLAKRGNRWWLAALPAVFMTVVTTSYIMVEKVGLGLAVRTGTTIGAAVGLACLAAFLAARPRMTPEGDDPVVAAQPTEAEKVGDDLAC
jgi:carbon starvation protein CstA